MRSSRLIVWGVQTKMALKRFNRRNGIRFAGHREGAGQGAEAFHREEKLMIHQLFKHARPWLAATALVAALGAQASAQDITIGAILPLTGPAAPTGIQEQQGVIFAV